MSVTSFDPLQTNSLGTSDCFCSAARSFLILGHDCITEAAAAVAVLFHAASRPLTGIRPCSEYLIDSVPLFTYSRLDCSHFLHDSCQPSNIICALRGLTFEKLRPFHFCFCFTVDWRTANFVSASASASASE